MVDSHPLHCIILDNNCSRADVKTLKAGMTVEDWLVLTNRADIEEKEMVGLKREFYFSTNRCLYFFN